MVIVPLVGTVAGDIEVMCTVRGSAPLEPADRARACTWPVVRAAAVPVVDAEAAPAPASADPPTSVAATRARVSSRGRGTRHRLSRGRGRLREPRRRRCPLDLTPVSEEPLLISDVQARVVAELARISPVTDELGARFAAAGEEIALVGGPVRDAMLGRLQQRPRLHHRRRAPSAPRSSSRAGPTRPGTSAAPSARSAAARATGRSRSRRTARRPTTPPAASPRWPTATTSTATWPGATSP